MKIVLIIQKPQARGAELFAAQLGQGLEDNGHQVMLISLFPGNFDLPFSGKHIRLNRNSSYRLWDWSGWKLIQQEVKFWNADLVLAMAGDTLKYMVMSKVVFGWKAKSVFYNGSLVSNYIHSSIIRNYNSFLFRKLDAVISVSQASAHDLDQLFPSLPTQYVIPVGIEMVERKRRDSSTIDLIHIGGFTFEKNHEGLLRIFSKILQQFPDIRLISFGAGPLDQETKQKAIDMGIADSIDWRGVVEKPFEKIENKAVLLLPSLIEGYPAVIVEAFLNKIPVVAYDVGGVGELVVHEKTGWLVPKNEEDAFLEKVIEVLNLTSAKLQSILKEANRFAVQNCLLPETVLKYEGTLNEIISPKRKSSLQILQLITQKQRRGAEIFAAQLSERLEEMGHEIRMVSVFEGDGELPFSKEVVCLGGKREYRFWDWKAWKKLNDLIRDFNPDIVQANASDCLKYAAFSKKIWGWDNPLIFRNANQMSLFLNHPIQRGLNNWWIGSVNGVASVSEICRNDFGELFPHKQPILLPIGIEPLDIQEKRKDNFSLPLPKRFLLFAGGLVPEKDPLGLLEIFHSILDPNLSLIFIGSGILENSLRERINSLGLQERVKIFDTQKNIFPILVNAEALLLPSKIEGLPAIVLEAMFCKIPVVAYGVGGIPEVVINGETGWCINPGDQKSFAYAVAEVVYQDPESKDKILENAFLMVQENFTLEKVSPQFEAYYRSILDS
ncbi:glycosyltransferase involved in cell wall biosynthesis [Algoriphagus boseongensis]|uniref:Glycosyltransferase involved in cell wall biosynthesis n=1 Tax=Algoriphagus boseongensis TaxID=1442587 RepID=A0A4R6T8H8_9BACT|nr:glycosyltransferase [Algoriphagus boseongensis]TDQ19568.1 glycosyltransferase involved in cell wall biosynthesis [Algoriphagus boseongensis]